MDKEMGMAVILGICVLVLVIGLMKRKAELLLNIMVRGVVGVIAIYCMNEFLATQGSTIAVGINPVSLITIGTLGVGGFGLLYGVLAYNML